MKAGVIGLGHGSRVLINAFRLSNIEVYGIASKNNRKAVARDQLNYQWQKDGVEIRGAVSPGYTNRGVWSGDAGVFPAVIKYIEDRKNVNRDIKKGNIRLIMLVEDNPRYYSIQDKQDY